MPAAAGHTLWWSRVCAYLPFVGALRCVDVAHPVPSGLALTLGVILVLAPWTVRNLRTIGASSR